MISQIFSFNDPNGILHINFLISIILYISIFLPGRIAATIEQTSERKQFTPETKRNCYKTSIHSLIKIHIILTRLIHSLICSINNYFNNVSRYLINDNY